MHVMILLYDELASVRPLMLLTGEKYLLFSMHFFRIQWL